MMFLLVFGSDKEKGSVSFCQSSIGSYSATSICLFVFWLPEGELLLGSVCFDYEFM